MVITRDDAEKKLVELEKEIQKQKKYTGHFIYGDLDRKIRLLHGFLEHDEYLFQLHKRLKDAEKFRDIKNKEIRETKDKEKKLDLIYQRNLLNSDLRRDRLHFKKQEEKAKFYVWHVFKIIEGTWKREDLPKDWL